jgi:hypothetical protein
VHPPASKNRMRSTMPVTFTTSAVLMRSPPVSVTCHGMSRNSPSRIYPTPKGGYP